MSTAYYPQSMRVGSKPSGYVAWKSNSQYGTLPGRMRPQTNKDYTNNVIYKHGLARPMKHYRKGRIMISDATPEHLKRQVRSGVGRGAIADLMDRPGCVSFSNLSESDQCNLCRGDTVVSSYFANPTFLSNNPPARGNNLSSPASCFNQERKAKFNHTKYKKYLQNIIPPQPEIYTHKCVPIVKHSNIPFKTQGAVSSQLKTSTDAMNTKLNVKRCSVCEHKV